jgi:ribulose-phosphate 3-epimerase
LFREKKIVLSASVACFNLYNIESQLEDVKNAGIDFLHFDVVDGRFNDCFILGTPTLKAIRANTKLPIEVHLAVFEPERYVGQFVQSGANYIAVHYEAMNSIDRIMRVFDLITSEGARPLLALRAETDVNRDISELIPLVDWVTKLTVAPGYAGQQLQQVAVKGIEELKSAVVDKNCQTRIQADGNINIMTIPLVVTAGATILTGGTSGLFREGSSILDNANSMLEAALSNLPGI